MTERRVSQRTGNTETCQREQEGEMEGEIEGGERRWRLKERSETERGRKKRGEKYG